MTLLPMSFSDIGELSGALWVLNLNGDRGQDCHFAVSRWRSGGALLSFSELGLSGDEMLSFLRGL